MAIRSKHIFMYSIWTIINTATACRNSDLPGGHARSTDKSISSMAALPAKSAI